MSNIKGATTAVPSKRNYPYWLYSGDVLRRAVARGVSYPLKRVVEKKCYILSANCNKILFRKLQRKRCQCAKMSFICRELVRNVVVC